MYVTEISDMDMFFKKITQPKLIYFYIFTCVNALAYAFACIFDFISFTFDTRKVNWPLFFISLAIMLLYFAFCILMRVKKLEALSTGLFYYQLLGSVAFIITFVAFMAGKESSVSFFSDIFKWWSMPLEPLCVVVARFTGTRLRYISGIVYIIMTYTTGATVRAIKKDIRYEKQYAEDHKDIVQ